MTDLFADINGIKLCYEIKGEGEPVLLIHGFGDRKEHWRAQFDYLSQYFKTIRLDNRGAGKSDRPDMVYTMDVYVEDIKGLLDFLNIVKTNIIGHSLGGMVVQNFAIKYPNIINKIILINTIAGMTPPGVSPDQGIEMYRKNAIASLKEMVKDPLNTFLNGAKNSYSRDFWKKMKVDPKHKFYGIWSVEDLIREKTEYGPTEKDINHQAEALKSHNVYEKLPEIKNDVLIIAAAKDKSCPKIMNEKIHNLLPNSEFIVIEKAAHQSILEYPQIINQHVREFLKN